MEIRLQQTNTNVLGGHVNPFSASARNMMHAMQQMIISRGGDMAMAARQAREMMFRIVQRQASMISYNTIFASSAGCSLLVPFIALMRRPSTKTPAAPMH